MFKRQCTLVFLIFLSLTNFMMGQTYKKAGQVFTLSSFVAADEVGEIILKRLPPVAAMNAMATDGPYMVRALAVGLANVLPSTPDWATLNFASEYYAGQTWYMCFFVANYNNTAAAIKIEFDLRYSDGAGRLSRLYSKTLAANTVTLYYISVTSYVAKLGLFTVNGQVYGAKMGNANKVMSQVYIY